VCVYVCRICVEYVAYLVFFCFAVFLLLFSDLSAGGHSDVLPTELGERIYEYVRTLVSKRNIFDIYIKCFFLNVTANAITA